MDLKNFRLDTDADGIATLTWDMPGKSMNVIDASVMDELERRDLNVGLVTLCIGAGMGTATIIERV